MNIPKVRCVNLDWCEVYCLESASRYPCDAEYFRSKGYAVVERDHGTRQYREMFVIEDERGNPWIEVRRNPASGDAAFTGFSVYSCHIRLSNRACYRESPIGELRAFLLTHDYTYQSIKRIDVCYDFEYFDFGDDPAKFIDRYVSRKYAKINQSKVTPHGEDNWEDLDWQSISWGARKSMVQTKLYNKTEELKAHNWEKTWIVWAWYKAGLITDPVNRTKVDSEGRTYEPKIWRVEFTLTSSAKGWIQIERQGGRKVKKIRYPHTLSVFDTREKLWKRFCDLAQDYFRFAKLEKGKRKDLCEPKKLFVFNAQTELLHVNALPDRIQKSRTDDILRRRLREYEMQHPVPAIAQAVRTIVADIDRREITRVVPVEDFVKFTAMQIALHTRSKIQATDVAQVIKESIALLKEGEIF